MQNWKTDFQNLEKWKSAIPKFGIWKIGGFQMNGVTFPTKLARLYFNLQKKSGTYKELMTTKFLKHIL